MGEQKKRARDARKDVSGWDTDEMLDVEGKVKFIGYEKPAARAKSSPFWTRTASP